jgi:hypothetical protein
MTSPTCCYERCTRPIHNANEGKCIFHAKEKDPQELRNALARQIRQWRKEKTRAWDFRGWVFVDVEDRDNLFVRAVFPVGAYFYSATFSGDASFYSATFSGDAFFGSATFSGDASFESATFSGDAVFGSAMFSRGTSFGSATFSGYADFRTATFLGDASFESATFLGDADFSSATLCSLLDMSYTCFAILGDFTNVTIGGNVELTWPGEGYARQEKGKEQRRGRLLLKNLKFEKKGDKEPLLNLRGNVLQEDCKLLIHDMKQMDKVLLEGTDCRLIEFKNVSWGEYKEKRHAKRHIVADEYYLRYEPSVFGEDKPSWNEIEETYEQLADRFRKDLKHPAANDFERGIFGARLEAAKAQKDWRNRFNCFLLGSYKFASDFSGSISRPFLWTLLLTLSAAAIYGWLLFDGFHNAILWPDFDKIWQSLIAALRVASLDRHWFSTAVDQSQAGGFARFILSLTAILQTLLTAILITLFIFSVRRRFKHTE